MLAALLLSDEVVWLVLAYAGAAFASTLFFYALTIRLFRPPPGSGGEYLKYGRELTFIGLLDPIVSQIDKIVVAHFWGPAQLAVYSIAMAVPARVTTAVKSLAGLGAPRFAIKTPKEINANFYTRIFQGAFFGAVVTIAYVVTAPYLFHFLLPQYIDSILYSQVLAISFIFAIPNRFVSLLLVSQKLSRQILFNNVVFSLLKIVLYVILGIWGGVFGLIVAYVLYSFIGIVVGIATWRLKYPA